MVISRGVVLEIASRRHASLESDDLDDIGRFGDPCGVVVGSLNRRKSRKNGMANRARRDVAGVGADDGDESFLVGRSGGADDGVAVSILDRKVEVAEQRIFGFIGYDAKRKARSIPCDEYCWRSGRRCRNGRVESAGVN